MLRRSLRGIWGVWAVDWINLAQYNVQCWDLVNTIIYLHVPQRDGSF